MAKGFTQAINKSCRWYVAAMLAFPEEVDLMAVVHTQKYCNHGKQYLLFYFIGIL